MANDRKRLQVLIEKEKNPENMEVLKYMQQQTIKLEQEAIRLL